MYRDDPDYGGEVNHGELLGRLAAYDGSALSTSPEALTTRRDLRRCGAGTQEIQRRDH